ncbi:guanine nucleotide binding protein alpha subunit [Rickenella mellea]|uniref:Guanine nucleotide binding protein alpha subunit n=1 Tax=Rickenella mellea TaxID=50990 RepID=A0A4Y7PZ89_9AGAM|nr:guanine nucleotide binding protein alpha subunit [Rickenella mellea]
MIRTQTRSSVYSADDPLALALQPPESESERERQARLKAEEDAKANSDRIDDQLRLERESLKKRRNEVKLLLLGQAESGKSTLQKQFQLLYAPGTLDQERASWRTVVYFNIIRTINRILDAVDIAEPATSTSGAGSAGASSSSGNSDAGFSTPSTSFSAAAGPVAPSTPPPRDSTPPTTAQARHTKAELARLRLRLSPLCSAEKVLADRLSGGVQVGAGAQKRGGGVYVRAGWQAQAGKKLRSGDEDEEDELTKIARVLANCREDVKELWQHPSVKGLVASRKMRLEESSEFFLNNISRIATSSPPYTPSTDDILYARLQTMGITQHTFHVSMHGKALAWHLFDVGGARGQRHTWVPYFDDANAIIFIAPVSAFDQYLEEDPRVNRINDSLQLWTQICSNELLKKVHLVLFLNKTDVLKQKLTAGVLVRKYITSYGERPNAYEPVVDYFRTHFLQVHRRTNEERRVLYTHLTSVVETKATHAIITNVQDSIFRGYLKEASLV